VPSRNVYISSTIATAQYHVTKRECFRTIYCPREKYNVRSALSFEPDFFARF